MLSFVPKLCSRFEHMKFSDIYNRVTKSFGPTKMVAVLIAGAVTFAICTSFSMPTSAYAGGERVNAVYRISFNGLDLGQFVFRSNNERRKYTLNGHAQISALLGAFKWKSTVHSTGKIGRVGFKPNHYAFNYKSNKKRGAVNMRFGGNTVTQVLAKPAIKKSHRRVPVKQRHLKGVLDPMSAVMALTNGHKGRVARVNPCKNKRLRLFDGKQRFDLILSYKRKERLGRQASRDLPRVAYVCKVKYVPIAGHKMNKDTKYMASNDGIEIWLQPVPRANMFVPYYVAIPTKYGTASLTSNRINIVTPGGRRIALVN